MINLLARLVEFCRRRAPFILAVTALLTIFGGIYSAQNLRVDTDTDKLVSPDLPWQKQVADYARSFPQSTSQTVVVVEGPAADAVEDATASLSAALAKRSDIFKTVRRPDAGPFFDTHRLLFLPVKELGALSDQLATAQPLIATLDGDPNLRGLFGLLDQAVKSAAGRGASLDVLKAPIQAFADATQSVVDGNAAPVQWRALVTGTQASPEDLRKFILVQPILDPDALQPGAKASEVIRQAAGALGLARQHVVVGLTGDIPLADDEFASVTEGAGTATLVSLVLVGLILLAGLRTPRLIVAIGLTLIVGLIATAAFATAVVGTLNMISVAFAVLFIGIAVDFGIQFSMRFQEEVYQATGEAPEVDRATVNRRALERAAKGICKPLAIAATAAGIGFYSFLPTDYRGVSELGVIAGTSMFIALLANLTVLPALLSVMPTRDKPRHGGFLWARPVDRWLQHRARPIVLVAFVLGLAALAATTLLRFDADPIDIKDPERESVRLATELAQDPLASPYSIELLTGNLEAAQNLVHRLELLPEVRQVVTLASFIPDRQDAKLEILDDLKMMMGPILDHGAPLEPPKPDEELMAAKRFESDFEVFLAGPHGAELGAAGPNFARSLGRWLKTATEADTIPLRSALLAGFEGRLDGLRKSLGAARVTIDGIPPEIKADWISGDGRARISIFPKGNMRDGRQFAQFVAAVRDVAPEATGMPVVTIESAAIVSHAFVFSSLLALAAITAVLVVILRRLKDVLLVLVPLGLATLYTLGTLVAIGMAFNYVNVIAIPLLLGVGVAFNIYFVIAWRDSRGPVALLQTSTARAVVFSACTTSTAFASLALSPHRGMASCGILLILALGYVLLSTIIIQPALMILWGRGRSVS
ncbi:MAG: hopanoid biosynthesis associated transporter like protein HpnN [Rhodospirillales bacterium]|nr:hopanoid biosynthesis associated transporter like protein HpnN [Rhodospirillales bacterium]